MKSFFRVTAGIAGILLTIKSIQLSGLGFGYSGSITYQGPALWWWAGTVAAWAVFWWASQSSH